MGTRSLTVINDLEGDEICVLYRQMDGYPTGHGKELADFLKTITLVNGLTLDEKARVANGMDCLAAQIVAHFKTGPGGFYLHPAGTRDCWENYIYTVYFAREGKDDEDSEDGDQPKGDLCLRVQRTYGENNVIYDGPVRDFDPEKVEASD